MMAENFSDRYSYKAVDAEIVVREDAPENLRNAILSIAEVLNMRPTAMRRVICQVLLVSPDSYNWSDYPNIWDEVNEHINTCSWFKVYDIAEALYTAFANKDPSLASSFENRLNQFFREYGIGWEMWDGEILFRGSKAFADITEKAVVTLKDTNRHQAANEIREAIRDVSRRPKPDVTGAIQHAMAALEATARDVTGQPNRTLGQIIPHLSLPPPLDTAVEKLWGYASDRARHVREGRTVETCEAELLVNIACAICTFISDRDQFDT